MSLPQALCTGSFFSLKYFPPSHPLDICMTGSFTSFGSLWRCHFARQALFESGSSLLHHLRCVITAADVTDALVNICPSLLEGGFLF